MFLRCCRKKKKIRAECAISWSRCVGNHRSGLCSFLFFFLPPLLLEKESIRQCKQHSFLFRFLHRFCFFFKRSSTFLALVLSIFLSHAGECVAASSQLGGGSKRGVCAPVSGYCVTQCEGLCCVCHKCPCQYFTSILHAEERVFI